MIAPQKHEAQFTIDVRGETTGESYTGLFRVLTRLTQRQRLQIDQIRRQLLGAQPNGAQPLPEAASGAEIIANLRVRVIDAPQWWVNSDGGLELTDDTVPGEIYFQAVKAEVDARKALQAAAQDATKELGERGPVSAPNVA